MFFIVFLLLAGMFIGYRGRKKGAGKAGRVIFPATCLLLFLMGAEVGSDAGLLRRLASLGSDALWITAGSVLGSCLAAFALFRLVPVKPSRNVRS